MRNGECGAIRSYLLQHGTGTPIQMAAAKRLPLKSVYKACSRMLSDGRLLLAAAPVRGNMVYQLGRIPDPNAKPPKQQAMTIKAAVAPYVAPPPTPARAETVAEWLAAGGRIDVLPSRQEPPKRYPCPGYLHD